MIEFLFLLSLAFSTLQPEPVEIMQPAPVVEVPIPPLVDDYYITQMWHGDPVGIDASTGICGSDIVSVLSGTIKYINRDPNHRSGLGKFILLSHSENRESLYSHFSEIVVEYGTEIKQGQVLGYIGNTGKSTACHIHHSAIGYRNSLLRGII